MDAVALAEKWREVVDSPYLRDLPFKLELNEDGKVEFAMSPATNRHSLFQGRLQALLLRMPAKWRSMPECSILTSKGVKVADVVWASRCVSRALSLMRRLIRKRLNCASKSRRHLTPPMNWQTKRNCIWKQARSRHGSSARMGRWSCTAPRDGGRNPYLESRWRRSRCSNPPWSQLSR